MEKKFEIEEIVKGTDLSKELMTMIIGGTSNTGGDCNLECGKYKECSAYTECDGYDTCDYGTCGFDMCIHGSCSDFADACYYAVKA